MSQPYQKRARKPIYDASTNEPPTDDQIERMRRQAKNVVLYWLGQGDQTRHYLTQKLEKKELTPDIIKEVLDEMEEADYLNDERYATNFARDALEFQKLGAYSIKQKLTMKGVDRDLIDTVLEEVTSDHDFTDAALELARKRLYPSRRLEPHKRVQNIAAYLSRRGYSGSDAFSAAKIAVQEATAEVEDLDYDE